MTFKIVENGSLHPYREIEHEMAHRIGFTVLLNENGNMLTILDDDGDHVTEISAAAGERSIVDFCDAYERGVEAGKRAKAKEIRDVLGC